MRSIRHFIARRSSGSVRQVAANYSEEFVDVRDMSAISDDVIVAEALRIVAKRMLKGTVELHSPRHTRDFLVLHFADLEYEVFTAIYLDNRHRVIGVEDLFRGTIDGASVHPREVVKSCLEKNAAAVIFAHNHPSGVAEPSSADQLITKRLKDALSTIEVRVLDHIVVGGNTTESFAERGLL